MRHAIEDIAAKMDALALWDAVSAFHWAVKPRGSAVPYFTCVAVENAKPVRARFMLLEGWQTFHDFVRTNVDHSYGFYSTPMEFPHYELIVLATGEAKLFRNDPGYAPVEANERQKAFCEPLFWECFGVMLRLETDRALPLSYAGDQAVFARVQGPDGAWKDEPLAIPPARPHVEGVRFPKEELKRAKDLPLATDDAVEADFAVVVGAITQEPRPRLVYRLAVADAKSGEKLLDERVSMHPEFGLRGMWEAVPARLLAFFVAHGRVPGEVRLRSQRLFRLMRPLCLELPFKLSLHDKLERL